MNEKGFTLIELLIVILVIAILAGLLLPALVIVICNAKETRCRNPIRNLEDACVFYNRDYNAYPTCMATDPFDSGPCVEALSRPGPKRAPYMDFNEEQVTSWPIGPCSHLRNPVDRTKTIHYRNNSMNPKPVGGPPVHNKFGIDIWAENCEGIPTGVNSWGLSQ